MRRAVLACSFLVVLAGGGVARAQTPEPRLEDYFMQGQIERSESYRGPRYAMSFGALGLSLVVLGAMGWGPGSRRLARWSERATRARWWVQGALLTGVVTAVPVVATLPLALLRHNHDRDFGLATNSSVGYLADLAKGLGFSLVLSAVGALLFVFAARRWMRAWPVIVAVGAAGVTFLLSFVFPVLYEPAFNRFEPAPEPLRARVHALAHDAGVEVRDVLITDASRRTTAHNAYVSGFGATKRVVLFDNLVRELPPPQVDLVVAHELAHDAYQDVLRGTALGAVGVVIGIVVLSMLLRRRRVLERIGARAPGDPAVVPFIALFIAVAGLVSQPAVNGISRSVEARADRAAIELTDDADTAVALEVSLALENIADLTPNAFVRWAFFTHPTTLERIGIALEAARS